jgi:hypothetical protein
VISTKDALIKNVDADILLASADLSANYSYSAFDDSAIKRGYAHTVHELLQARCLCVPFSTTRQ